MSRYARLTLGVVFLMVTAPALAAAPRAPAPVDADFAAAWLATSGGQAAATGQVGISELRHAIHTAREEGKRVLLWPVPLFTQNPGYNEHIFWMSYMFELKRYIPGARFALWPNPPGRDGFFILASW